MLINQIPAIQTVSARLYDPIIISSNPCVIQASGTPLWCGRWWLWLVTCPHQMPHEEEGIVTATSQPPFNTVAMLLTLKHWPADIKSQYMMTSLNGNISCIWEGNSLVTSQFPSQRPVTQSFDGFFYLYLNKGLCKQSRHQCLWDAIVLIIISLLWNCIYMRKMPKQS